MADDQRGERGETRVDLAEDRTLLANERTYAGWMRTGLAAVGIGVGFHALFQKMEPDWVPRAIATAFLLIGIAVTVAAERRACALSKRLSPHVVVSARGMNLKLITWAMALATLALIGGIWLARIGPSSGM
jgi:putative membrane protein